MKRFFAFFVVLLLCLMSWCYAVKHILRVPYLDITEMIEIEDCTRIYEEEKLNFINSLMKRVWNEDFGKFTELFYKHHFKIPMNRKCAFESMHVTEDTILTNECLMKYLYSLSTKGCLDFFKCWIDFYKSFQRTETKKEKILESFREFVCRFLVGIARDFYVSDELLREKITVLCKLYEL